MTINGLIDDFAGQPVLLAAILFLVPFVLEEAAMLAAAGVAMAGFLSPPAAFVASLCGIIASDWLLFGLGHLAGRVQRIRQWVGEGRLTKSKKILGKGPWAAAVVARLVPWLLMPLFVTSGMVGMRFRLFAAINATVAFIYAGTLFVVAYRSDALLIRYFQEWGWVIAGAVFVIAVAAIAIADRKSTP